MANGETRVTVTRGGGRTVLVAAQNGAGDSILTISRRDGESGWRIGEGAGGARYDSLEEAVNVARGYVEWAADQLLAKLRRDAADDQLAAARLAAQDAAADAELAAFFEGTRDDS